MAKFQVRRASDRHLIGVRRSLIEAKTLALHSAPEHRAVEIVRRRKVVATVTMD